MNKPTISPYQAKIYEIIKSGMSTAREIANHSGIEVNSVRAIIADLMRLKLIRTERIGRRANYFVSGLEYNISTSKQQFQHHMSGLGQIEDRLVRSALDVKLTDDQLLYLKGHKQEKRSVLAKKLGIPKVQLNFMLERLG